MSGQFGQWHEEEDLKFTDEEQEKFQDVRYGNDCRRLVQNAVSPTLLHSYGHGLRACSCGCRARFTDERLLTHGLRGFGVRSAKYPFDRFLHCQEVAFLLTVPSLVSFQPGGEELPLLGQIAAPLQAVWMGHELLRALHLVQGRSLDFTATDAVVHYKSKLFEWRQDTWVWRDSLADRFVSMQLAMQPARDHSPFKTGLLTCEQLIRAESVFACWGEKLQVFDGQRRLSPTAIVQTIGRSGPCQLSVTCKQQRASKPDGTSSSLFYILNIYIFSFLALGSRATRRLVFWKFPWDLNPNWSFSVRWLRQPQASHHGNYGDALKGRRNLRQGTLESFFGLFCASRQNCRIWHVLGCWMCLLKTSWFCLWKLCYL